MNEVPRTLEPIDQGTEKSESSKIKSNICRVCRKSFSKPSLLQRHETVHSKEKLFECHLCEKRFTQKSSQRRHIQHTHEGLRTHQCPKCDRSFSQRINLDAHLSSTHPSKPNKHGSYSCSKCSCIFTKLNVLNRHIAAQHADGASEIVPSTSMMNLDDFDAENPEELANRVTQQLKILQTKQQNQSKSRLNQIESNPGDDGERLNNLNLQAIPQITAESNEGTASTSLQNEDWNEPRDERIQPSEVFQCSYCIKSFPTKSKLKSHSKRHTLDEVHGILNNQHVCPLCSVAFDSMYRLDAHVRTHEEADSMCYLCTTCDRKFKTKKALARHSHHSKKEDSEFNSLKDLLCDPINLLEGEENTENPKTYKCIKCNLRLSNESSLQKHEQRHLNNNKYKCLICRREFLSSTSLNIHKAIHATGKRKKMHTCPNCPERKFVLKTQLKRHILLVHENIRNWKCTYCDRTFKSKANCNIHIGTHLKRLLRTNTIESESSLPANDSTESYKVHVIVNPSKGNPSSTNSPKFIELQMLHNCRKHTHRNFQIEKLNRAINAMTAQTTLDVANAKEEQNTKSKNCNHCSKTFKKPSDLERHSRIHLTSRPFVCETCHKSFKLKSTLNEHQRTHLTDEERTKANCQVCGKKYASKKSLMVHQRLHTLDTPFKCDKCERKFRTSGHLIAHKKASAKLQEEDHCIGMKKSFINISMTKI